MADDRCDLLCLDLDRAEIVRSGLLAEDDAAHAARGAGALADATRLRTAVALAAAGELCGCDVAWVTGRSDKLVSHHLRTLREAGLAESRRDGRVIFYRLTDMGHMLLDAILAVSTPSVGT